MKRFGFGKRGWLMVLWAFLVISLASAIPSTIQVAVDLFAAKGFNPTVLMSLMTFGSLGTLVCLFGMNFLTAKGKLSFRKLGMILGILWAVFTALWGVVSVQWLFIAVYILSFLSCQLMVLVVVNNIVANWFPTRKGSVIGLATMGFMLGAMAGVLLLGNIVASSGNITVPYFIFAVVILLVALMGYLLFPDYPEECGCFPDNDQSMTSEEAKKQFELTMAETAKSPWTQKRILSTWQVWLIAISCGIMLLFSQIISSQLVARLTWAGYDPMTAMMMFMGCSLFGCFGSWIIGVIDNRIGPRNAAIITMSAMVIACILTTLNSTPLMIVAICLLGVELGGSSNFTMSLVATYWGRRNFGKVYGVVVIVQQIIGSFGALFASTTSAAWGYNVTYLIMAGMAAVSLVILLPIKNGFVQDKELQWERES